MKGRKKSFLAEAIAGPIYWPYYYVIYKDGNKNSQAIPGH